MQRGTANQLTSVRSRAPRRLTPWAHNHCGLGPHSYVWAATPPLCVCARAGCGCFLLEPKRCCPFHPTLLRPHASHRTARGSQGQSGGRAGCVGTTSKRPTGQTEHCYSAKARGFLVLAPACDMDSFADGGLYTAKAHRARCKRLDLETASQTCMLRFGAIVQSGLLSADSRVAPLSAGKSMFTLSA